MKENDVLALPVLVLVWQRVVIEMMKQGQMTVKQGRIYLAQEASENAALLLTY